MVTVSVSTSVTGGFLEGNVAYLKRWGIPINSRPLPAQGELVVSDASTPVANFRVEEAFMSLVALARTPKNVKVLTDVGCGGTYDEYGRNWSLSPKSNSFWIEFYVKTGIMGRIDNKFSPVAACVYDAINIRKQAISRMWSHIAPHFNSSRSSDRFESKVYEKEFGHLKISSLVNTTPEGAVILTFPCVVCSHQTQTTAYHAIRRRGNGMYVAKTDRSPSQSGCKGGFSWNEHWDNLTVWQATFLLGGRLSGKSIYELSSRSSPKPGMMIRDYSDPRGTVAATVQKWSKDLWISPRVYVKRAGNDGSIKDFERSLVANPKSWATTIDNFPMFGDGRQHDVTY